MRKNYTVFNFLSLGFILFSIFLLVYIFQEDTSSSLVFEDEGLELAVREAIDKEEGEILLKDVELLQTLDAKGHDIKSLEGIEALLELRELDLEDNFVESVKPLKNLTKLEKLNLRNNEITSLEEIDFQEILFLNIRDLSLRHNVKRDKEGNGTRLADITMLGEMVSLRKLKLRDNHIEDLSPLSNLRRLTELDIRENKFTTIEPLEVLTRLTELNLRENKIESLEPIKYLSRLTYLNIHSDTDIKSLAPIGNLVNLETLIMRNVSLADDSDFLRNLTKLQRFNAIDSDIETVDPTIFSELIKKGALQGDVRPIRMLHTLEAPQLSQESGFYQEEFQLKIKNPEEKQEIYYTLDGSEPTLNSDKYTEPIEIADLGDNEATVVRAKILSDNNLMSETVTKTYFVNDKINERFTLPIFSLVTDPDNLFDEEIGIYTEDNAFNRGSDWERPTHMEFFEEDGTLALNQEIGLRIHGNTSRGAIQKSLRLYAKSEYDELDSFQYQFFEDLEIDNFNRLLLRQSGNDRTQTMFNDGMIQDLVSTLETIDTQAFEPAVLFINGEYYGIQNIRERQDEYYLANHYNLDLDETTILKNEDELLRGGNRDVYHYTSMLEYIENNDIKNDEHLTYVETLMDTDNYIDYFASEIFFANADWPGNNIKFWRKTTDEYKPDAPYGHDGRWRWMMFDMDFGFYRNDEPWGDHNQPLNHEHNTIHWVMTKQDGVRGNRTWPNFLFRNLMENESFQNRFFIRFNDLVNSNFTTEIVNNKIQELTHNLENEIPNQINRWGSIESEETWRKYINRKYIFAKERPALIRQFIMEEFDITNTIEVNVGNESDMGHVRLNTIDINSDLPGNIGDSTWSGTYFTDIPITVEAIAKDGYEFSHWEGINSNEEKAEITPTADLTIRAVFVKMN